MVEKYESVLHLVESHLKKYESMIKTICLASYDRLHTYTVQLKCNVACTREQLEGSTRVPGE